MTQAFRTLLLIYSVLIVQLHLPLHSIVWNWTDDSRADKSCPSCQSQHGAHDTVSLPGIQNCVGIWSECVHLVIKQYVLDTDRVNSVMPSNLHNVGWYNLADLDTDRLNSVMSKNQYGLVQWILTDWTLWHLKLNIMWAGTIKQPPKCLHKFNQINMQVCSVVSLTKFHFYMFNVCVFCHVTDKISFLHKFNVWMCSVVSLTKFNFFTQV